MDAKKYLDHVYHVLIVRNIKILKKQVENLMNEFLSEYYWL